MALAAVLIVYAAVGSHARYWQDDYCWGAVVRDRGWLGAQQAMYERWSGKPSWAAALSGALWIGPRVVPVLPTVALLSWWAALAWAVSGIMAAIGQPVTWTAAAAISLIGLFAVVDRLPDFVHAVYWQTGLLVYVASLVALAVAIGAAARWPSVQHRMPGLVALAILAFVSGGFSETTVVVQASALGAIGAWLVGRAESSVRRRWLPPAAAGLAGSIAVLTVMLAAPGNAVRMSASPPRAALAAIAVATTKFAAQHLGWWLLMPPFAVGLLLVAGILVGRRVLTVRPDRPWRTAGRLVLCALGLVWVSVFPAVWVYGPATAPEGRGYTVASFVLTWGVFAASVMLCRVPATDRLVRWWTATPRRTVAAVAILMLSPAWSVARPILLLPQLRTYAAAWDARDPWIRQQVREGARTLAVTPLPTIAGLNDVARDPPRNWVNGCIAAFYGLDEIIPQGTKP